MEKPSFTVTSLLSGAMEIDAVWGMEQLSAYLARAGQLAQGATVHEVGFSEMRQATGLGFISLSEAGQFAGTTSNTAQGQRQIAHARLSGVMFEDSGLCHTGVRELGQRIREADANPDVIGGILEVSSGGGQAAAGSLLNSVLQDTTKPWAIRASLAASAAYKVALPAFKIYAASEDSRFGSVGTMASLDKRALERIKDTEIEIYADQATLKNNEYRELQKGNFKPLKEALTAHNATFIKAVATAREINPAYAGRVFSGDMMLAQEAQEAGLIDGVRTFNEVIKEVAAEADRRAIQGTSTINTNTDMDFKSFMPRLVSVLASAGFSVSQTEDADKVLAELQEQVGTVKQSMIDAAVQAAVEAVKPVQATQVTESTDALATAQAQLKATADELAALKLAQASHGQGMAQSAAPNIQQFQTGKTFGQFATVGGEAKYK